MILHLKKIDNCLYPCDDESANYLFQVKQGTVLKANVSKPRNYIFHQKYFALLNLAYDSWDPVVEHKGVKIEKNFDKFREDIQIMAGYGDAVINLNGEVRYKSKSISFGSMSPEDFEKLYSNVINVILQKVLHTYTEDDLERVVEEVLSFA
jgi:hypothetical protein